MDLKDLDRPVQSVRFDAWDCDVQFRPLGATELLKLNGSHPGVHGTEVNADGLARFYAELLACSVVSHRAASDEWLECKMSTLTELGTIALRVSGLIEDEAKKN